MNTDFVFEVKFTIIWLNGGSSLYLDLHEPDFPKSTSKYLCCTKVVRKHGCFTVMRIFWMQCNFKEISELLNHSNVSEHICSMYG